MAIRYREGKKSPWCVYWDNPITHKRESRHFGSEEEAKRENEAILLRLKTDRASFVKRPVKVNPTLSEAFELYMESKKDQTYNTYRTRRDALKFTLAELGHFRLADISKGVLRDLQQKLVDRGLAATTVRLRMHLLYAILTWAQEQDMCPPIKYPRVVEAHYQQFIPPTPSELADLYKHGSPTIQRVIVIGSQCGVRVGPSELFNLKWEDVDLPGGTLKVHGAVKNKAALWRDVPIKKSLIPTFTAWKEADEKLGYEYIVHNDRGKPVQEVKTAWAKACEAAGIKRHIRPYDLRHAFATQSIAAGADIGTIAKIMGHANANMILLHYQYVMDKQKRAAVEKIPDIEGL